MKKIILALILFPLLAHAALRGTAVNATTSTGTSNVITVSGIGIVLNDQVLCAMNGGGSGGANTLTPPSGFNAISGLTQQDLNTSSAFMIWMKTATGSEPSTYTFTMASADFSTVVCRAYSGRSATITAKTLTSATAVPIGSPSAVPLNGLAAATGDDVVAFTGVDNGEINPGNVYTISTPAGFANALTTYAAATGFTPIVGSSDHVNVSSGATGTLAISLTWTGAQPQDFAGFVISMPASGGSFTNKGWQVGTGNWVLPTGSNSGFWPCGNNGATVTPNGTSVSYYDQAGACVTN